MGEAGDSAMVFQTDLCGVEAGRRKEAGPEAGFQTDLCGVEASAEAARTRGVPWFQTDPCGVEARHRRDGLVLRGLVSDGPLWG
jgi:hypothetical protein